MEFVSGVGDRLNIHTDKNLPAYSSTGYINILGQTKDTKDLMIFDEALNKLVILDKATGKEVTSKSKVFSDSKLVLQTVIDSSIKIEGVEYLGIGSANPTGSLSGYGDKAGFSICWIR